MSKTLNYTYKIFPESSGYYSSLRGTIYLQNIRDETGKSPDIQKGDSVHFSFDSTQEPIIREVYFTSAMPCLDDDINLGECGYKKAEVICQQIDGEHYKTDITVPFVQTTTLMPNEIIRLTFKNEDFSRDVAEGYMKSMEVSVESSRSMHISDYSHQTLPDYLINHSQGVYYFDIAQAA